MSVDMTKWCEIAKANMGKRPAGEGRLGGKICIVTGAAQGFGKGIAEELYKEGATIVIADMNEPLAKQVAEEMGERAVSIAVNVSDEESVANMVAQTVEKFGVLDLMLSNAGVVRSGPIAHVEKKDFDFVTSVNYTGFFLCAKYAAIIMEASTRASSMFSAVNLGLTVSRFAVSVWNSDNFLTISPYRKLSNSRVRSVPQPSQLLLSARLEQRRY